MYKKEDSAKIQILKVEDVEPDQRNDFVSPDISDPAIDPTKVNAKKVIHHDEIQAYKDTRYLTALESMYRIF
jgi:hypothetical protein